MDENLEAAAKGIFDRAKSIIMSPKDEWPKIEAETKPQGAILTGYVLPLVAIGPIASLIGSQLFGYGAFGITYRPPLVGSIVTAIVSFAIGVAMVYLLSFIVDWLAPKFGGQSNKANAFKLVAYGGTAAWVVGIFSLIPMLGLFGILGLYSLYLYYTGAAPLMKVPEDKSVGYVAVVIVCAILASFLIAPITMRDHRCGRLRRDVRGGQHPDRQQHLFGRHRQPARRRRLDRSRQDRTDGQAGRRHRRRQCRTPVDVGQDAGAAARFDRRLPAHRHRIDRHGQYRRQCRRDLHCRRQQLQTLDHRHVGARCPRGHRRRHGRHPEPRGRRQLRKDRHRRWPHAERELEQDRQPRQIQRRRRQPLHDRSRRPCRAASTNSNRRSPRSTKARSRASRTKAAPRYRPQAVRACPSAHSAAPPCHRGRSGTW